MDSFNKIPPHGIVRNWLGVEVVERLLTYARSNKDRFKESQVTSWLDGSQRIDPTVRISRKLGLGDLKDEVTAKFEQLLPTIFETLRLKPFIPTLELQFVAHGNGAFFSRHRDTLRDHHRIITAVYYFHALPKAFSGGVLRLHSLAATGERGTFVDIFPEFDMVAYFPSMFLHEVLPIESASGEFLDSRFAINCWFVRQSADTRK
jgi:Rps23 Pro-64 3,4-dihydroxylase Tpa1-like proline 4-hydroxylase